MLNDDFDDKDEIEPRYYTARVYLQDQAYGGPEEGGWYYTCGQFEPEFGHMTRAFKTLPEAIRYARSLHRDVLDELNKHRRSQHSVLSQGEYWAKVWNEEAPIKYPESKPHYK